MTYFKILLGVQTFQSFLTYSHDSPLEVGQVVAVPIRNKLQMGIIIGQFDNEDFGFDKAKIKPISEVFPIIFPKNRYNLLFSFSQNTFNSINSVLEAFLHPYKYLTKKQLKTLNDANTEATFSEQETSKNTSVELDLNDDVILRIIYIIRSSLNKQPENNVLIVLPERKSLERIVDKYNDLIGKGSEFTDLPKFEIYFGEKSKASSNVVYNLLTKNSNYIFSLRAGIFLPFQNLTQVILVDEANGFYIQDQNSIYYDTRDAIYLLAKSYEASLNYISTLPSVRFARSYDLLRTIQ